MSQPIAPSIAMATPIQTLPPQGGASEGPTDMSDPLVSDVLNEMEKEVQTASHPNGPIHHLTSQMNSMAIPSPTPMVPMMAFPTSNKKEWIHMDNLKRVALCMLLSFILFHPTWIFPQLYERFHRFTFLQTYDQMIRVVLFGLFLYVLLTYVPYP